MKKLKFFCLFLIIVSTKLFAQNDKKIDGLTFLYVDEKYDKVVFKGEAMMQSDKYKKHPLVYIYTSMSYYEMARRPGKFDVGEKDAQFPKPLKMAQKHLYKFVKLDKKAPKYFGNSWYEDFKEYYVLLADTSNKLAQYFFLNGKYRKAASVYKAAFRGIPSDPVLQLWKGISEVKSKNTVEGDKTLIAAMKAINENFVPSKATAPVLAHGMLLVEEYYRKKGDYKQADKAKKLIKVFKKYDPDELDKKKMEERKEKAVHDDRIMRKFYSDENDEENKNKQKEKLIIEDGDGSHNADKELDKLEREAKEDGK